MLCVKLVVIGKHFLEQLGRIQPIWATGCARAAAAAIVYHEHLFVPLVGHIGLIGGAAEQAAHACGLGNVYSGRGVQAV